MVIVNDLSLSNRRRDRMVNSRNGLTYTANILILVVALIFFEVFTNKVIQFRYLCVMCVIVGCGSSLFFVLSIQESRLVKEAVELDKAYK
jgi:Na+/melibiose symporter-like transporter